MKIQKINPLFSVVFEDGSYFVGGENYHQTKWREIPNKNIKRIFYRLPDGIHLELHGYEKYFHMIEAIKDLTGSQRGIVKLQYAYIIGKKDNKVVSYRIALFNNEKKKQAIGDISRRVYSTDDAKIKGLNPEGWK